MLALGDRELTASVGLILNLVEMVTFRVRVFPAEPRKRSTDRFFKQRIYRTNRTRHMGVSNNITVAQIRPPDNCDM